MGSPIDLEELVLGKACSIVGWMSVGELAFLADTARRSKTIIEVGSYHGKSTRALADNSPPDARIYAVDPWDYYFATLMKCDINTLNQFYINLYNHIKAGKVTLCKSKWEDYNPKELVDFIFIDGDHTYESACHDIDKAMKWINPGGIIAGHDYNVANFPGVKKAVEERFNNINSVETIWWVQR
jgi:predicted O-methyltransferase YrrM